MSTATINHECDWISGARARRILGCAYSGLQRLVILRRIRVQLELGCAPRYNLDDVQRLAGQQSVSASA